MCSTVNVQEAHIIQPGGQGSRDQRLLFFKEEVTRIEKSTGEMWKNTSQNEAPDRPSHAPIFSWECARVLFLIGNKQKEVPSSNISNVTLVNLPVPTI